MIGQKRPVRCYHCGRELLVSSRAFSVCCPGCSGRGSVENVAISNSYERGCLETCGERSVEQEGSLRARVKASQLMVAGKMQGDTVAEGKVTLTATAKVRGDIKARRLEVQDGAVLKGYCKIGPDA